jgi:hypothetical protein
VRKANQLILQNCAARRQHFSPALIGFSPQVPGAGTQ